MGESRLGRRRELDVGPGKARRQDVSFERKKWMEF